ncbi:MAG: glycerol kinase GlpK [Spirochaetota bacterium]
MAEYIIGIDAGTTGIRTFCFDKQGKVISTAYEEFTQIFPKPGWVEHDAEEIWHKTEKLIVKAISKGKLKKKDAVAIGITNQRETTVVFDRKTGKPVYNAIVWQCRRTSDFCQKLKEQGLEEEFRQKTGLVVDAYFSGTKIHWILNKVKGLKAKANKGQLAFGTIDTWLLYKLTGQKEHKTDYTNASRTLVYNIQDKVWDEDLLKVLQIPSSLLPEVQGSRSDFGVTEGVKGLPNGIPITSLVGDQQGALFGQLCTEVGEAKNTYGTGCFMLFVTGDEFQISQNGLLTTLACSGTGKPIYALEGSIFIGGAVMQWLRDGMKFFKKAADSEHLVSGLKAEDEVTFVPAFAGLGAPYWDMNARGAIYGLTRDTTIAQITRAALKSIALQSQDLTQAMEKDIGKSLKVLKVDGGATANNYLMQYQADILGKKVMRPENIDTTVLGAAYLAGLQAGFFSSVKSLKRSSQKFKEFKPKMRPAQRKQEIDRWHTAIERTRSKS